MSGLAGSTTYTAAKPATKETADDRLCLACGRSIADKPRHPKYCDARCGDRFRKQRERRRDAEDKVAANRRDAATRWRRSLRPDADIDVVIRAVADGRRSADLGRRLIRRLIEDRLAMLRGSSQVKKTGRGVPYGGCSHRVVGADEDGDALCAKCGRSCGRLSTSLARPLGIAREMGNSNPPPRKPPQRPWTGEDGKQPNVSPLRRCFVPPSEVVLEGLAVAA